jgi:hypothetical protein
VCNLAHSVIHYHAPSISFRIKERPAAVGGAHQKVPVDVKRRLCHLRFHGVAKGAAVDEVLPLVIGQMRKIVISSSLNAFGDGLLMAT